MIQLQSGSELWSFLSIIIFSALILGYCCRCHTSDVNVDNSVGPDVRPNFTGSPSSLSSTNCPLQDSRRTKRTSIAEVLPKSEVATRYVAVFNMDRVLCVSLNPYNRRKDRLHIMNHTECPHIWVRWEGEAYLQIFLPHLQILFSYLLEHGVRIAFFSGRQKIRNLVVVPELLRSFWGNEKYEELKSKGQFRIHGQNDYRRGNHSCHEGSYVKDLRLIIQDGEALSNAVLVEDDSYYSVHDQKPAILVGMFTEYNSNYEGYYNPLNNVYYLLGLFKTYFENEKYRTLPLRDAMAKIIPTKHTGRRYEPFAYYFYERHPFVREMVDLGFVAVREVVPHATLYKEYRRVERIGECKR